MANIKKRKVILWTLWALIVPPGFYLIFQYFPPPEISFNEAAAYLIFFILACLLPMNINGVPTYLVQWLTIAVFLKFGLFAEVVLSQITMIIVILRIRTFESLSVRIPFNSMMFFAISVLAGLIFKLAGGQIGSLDLWHILIFGLLFQTVSVVANQMILYIYVRILGEHKDFFSADTIWDFCIAYLVFPLAIILYISETYIGMAALVLLGIPFFTLTAIMRMYNNSEKVNSDLKKAGEIGHQLAARLSADEVLDQFVTQVADLFQVDYAYVIDYRDGKLLMLRRYEDKEFLSIDVEPSKYNEGVAGNAIVNNTSYIFDNQSQWKAITAGYVRPDTESLMAMPISRNNKIEGVLVLGSRSQHAFVHHQLQILDILSTYFAVSLEKAA